MKILVCNWNGILNDVVIELRLRGHTILPEDGKTTTWKKADVIVVWNETALAGWRDWILKVKKAKKRVVLVQHGRRGTSRIYPPFNEALISDAVCVWGENDKQRLMSVGVPEDKIHVTGTPIFRHLKSKVRHEGKNVVFSPEHWDVDVAENLIVSSKLQELRGVKVSTKILAGHQDPKLYDNPIVSERNSPDHFSIVAETLSTADVVVGISESTFELMAEYLDIPVVIADIWIPKACDGDDRYKEYHREYSDACARVKNIGELNREIMFHMNHAGLLSAKRKEIAILDGGTNLEDPIGNIIKVITQ